MLPDCLKKSTAADKIKVALLLPFPMLAEVIAMIRVEQDLVCQNMKQSMKQKMKQNLKQKFKSFFFSFWIRDMLRTYCRPDAKHTCQPFLGSF